MLTQVESMKGTESVREAFKAKLIEKAGMAFKCWPHMIRTYLESADEVVEAGQKMGVTSTTTFSDEERKELAESLAPLAELEMHERVREILIPRFVEKGYDETVITALTKMKLS